MTYILTFFFQFGFGGLQFFEQPLLNEHENFFWSRRMRHNSEESEEIVVDEDSEDTGPHDNVIVVGHGIAKANGKEERTNFRGFFKMLDNALLNLCDGLKNIVIIFKFQHNDNLKSQNFNKNTYLILQTSNIQLNDLVFGHG